VEPGFHGKQNDIRLAVPLTEFVNRVESVFPDNPLSDKDQYEDIEMSAKLAQLRNSTPVRLAALFTISLIFMMAAALSA
jgi:hypothetical protein